MSFFCSHKHGLCPPLGFQLEGGPVQRWGFRGFQVVQRVPVFSRVCFEGFSMVINGLYSMGLGVLFFAWWSFRGFGRF